MEVQYDEQDAGIDRNNLDSQSLLEICQIFAPDNELHAVQTYGELVTIEKPLWDELDKWFSVHSLQTERYNAVTQTDDVGMTVLHVLLRNYRSTPVHIIQLVLDSAPEVVVQQPDSFSWLPMHYAAAFKAPLEVVALLRRHHPESLIAIDRRGRLPIHFALGNTKDFEDPDRLADTIQFVKYLISGVEEQVTRKQDDNGMLPIHYACAYGSPVQIIDMLRKEYPESLIKQDKRGKTPLHYVMSNQREQTSPTLQYIFQDEIGVKSMGIPDSSDNLPLHYLSAVASYTTDYQTRKIARRCLIQYLDVPNAPPADYFSALRTLPNWLQATAFANPGVLLKDVLNENTAKPLPTMILLLDFYMLIALIFFFQLAVEETISCMYQGIKTSPSQSTNLVIMFITAIYFTFREVFQIYSMIQVGIFFQAWVKDLSNLIDLFCIILTYFWFSKMLQDCDSFDQDQQDIYRSGMAITTGIYWLNFLLYLRATSVDFAVFVGGVIYVMRSLATFLVSLLIVLIAFAQMFYNVSQGTNRCLCNDLNLDNMNDFVRNRCLIENDDGSTSSIVDESSASQNFCNTYQESLLTVYYMMVGQAETEDVTFSVVSTALFCIFMFLAVILLTNMLIAIVTESYVFVKDYNSSEVFWSNRFAFLVEVDPINRLYSQMRKKKQGQEAAEPPSPTSPPTSGDRATTKNAEEIETELASPETNEEDRQSPSCFLSSEKCKAEKWNYLIKMFEPDLWEDLEFVEWIVFPIAALLVVIILLIWICLGIMTAGLLWPNQVRKYLLEQRVGSSLEINENDYSNNNFQDDSTEHKSSKSSTSRGIQRQSSLLVSPTNNNNGIHNNPRLQQNVADLSTKVDSICDRMVSTEDSLSTLTSEMSEIKALLLRLDQRR